MIKPGSSWKHKSGRIYEIMTLANEHATLSDKYPVTVVYRRKDDNTVWSRTLDRWDGSFEEIEDSE